MVRKLMGKKCGMVRLFAKDGKAVACTLIRVDTNVVAQIKTKSIDGYEAIQLAAEKIVVNDQRTVQKRVSMPLLGHYKKSGVNPAKRLHEMLVDDASSYSVGQSLGVSLFDGAEYVDVVGTSKGRGFQGVMKKYGFAGGPASHGSGFHRHAGSTGMRSSPGRCLQGGPRPSHMGDQRKTVQNMKVFAIDAEKGLIIVEGSVPGSNNSYVFVCDAKKQHAKKTK
jgi:large subunit ribosomal protein L3